MDLKKVEALRRKYWEGKTNHREEEELKKLAEDSRPILNLENDYFRFLDKKSLKNALNEEFDEELLKMINKKQNETRQKTITLKYWYVAASLALIISASIIFNEEMFNDTISDQIVTVDTFEDPREAFEETKRALLFISSKLNQGNEVATQFSKFEQSQKILKQN